MPSLNLEKLVVIFLIVAVLSGSSIFAFSIYDSRPDTIASGNSAGRGSAFIEKLPPGLVDPDWEAANYLNRENATNKVAEMIARAVIAKNPGGPLEDQGESAIILPKEADGIVDNYFVANPPSLNILKSGVDITKVKFVPDNASNNTKYFVALSELSEGVNTLESNSQNSSYEELLTLYSGKLGAYSSKLEKMEVPLSLYKFHKSVAELYMPLASYSKLLSEDPLSAAALQPNFEKQLAGRIAALDEASRQLEQLSVLPDGSQSFIANILGIKTAYATVPTIDYVRIAIAIKDFIIQYQEIIEKIAIGYAKNVLLKKITEQVIKWALGEGTPQFVTNWQGFLKDAVSQGAGEIIESVAPALCGSASGIGAWTGLGNIADLLDRFMSPVDLTDYSSRTACTLDRVVSNVKDFGSDLRNGGWLGYSALLEPQNTLFGSVITIADLQLQKAEEKKDAALQKAVSGGGYTGTEICDNGKKPKVIAKTRNITSLEGGIQTKEGPPLLQCEDGSTPRVTTPGTNSSGLITKSFDAAYDRLVNANDYAALLEFLAGAYITKLMQSGAKGIGGSASASGGTGSTTPGATPAERAQQILEVKEGTLNDARAAQRILTQTLQVLQQVVSTCTTNEAVAAQASAYATAVMIVQNELSILISSLNDQVTRLKAMVSSGNFGTLDSFGTLAAAQQESRDIAAKGEAAEEVFLQAQSLYGSCSGDVLSTPPPMPTSTATSTEDGGEGELP